MTTRQLLIATGNRHKLEEMHEILMEIAPQLFAVDPLELLCAADFPQFPEPREDGADFTANALIKARYWAAATGLPALADDSGLVIDALGGRPGIHSARYAATPAARIERVLRELDGVPPTQRTARFECVMAFCPPAGDCLTRAGRVEGRITLATRGAGGFGYDPIFELTEPPQTGRTMAELASAEKHALSHRGRALRAIWGEIARAAGWTG